MKGKARTIFVVDDHSYVRKGLRLKIETNERYVIEGESASAEDALLLLKTLKPKLLITDISLPGMSGLQFIEEVLNFRPDQRILVMSRYAESVFGRQSKELGARGYISKLDLGEKIFEAIEEIFKGQFYFNDLRHE